MLTLQQGFPAQTAANKILNTAGVSPNYRPAYAQIWMLGTETSFTQNWLLDLTYTGTKGTNLDLLRAPNRAPLGTGQLNTQTDLQIPYATSFYYDQSGANSIYNALQVRVVHRYTHGVSFQGAYTFSKSIDNASSIGGAGGIVVQQDGNYAAERGLSSFDMRHQFRFSSTYELPFGERNRWANHGWKEHALGNLRLLNTVTWHTGTPLTVYLGGSAANNSGTGSNFSERANLIGNPNLRNLRGRDPQFLQHRCVCHAACGRIWRRAPRLGGRPVPVQLEPVDRKIGALRTRTAAYVQRELGNSEPHEYAEFQRRGLYFGIQHVRARDGRRVDANHGHHDPV